MANERRGMGSRTEAGRTVARPCQAVGDWLGCARPTSYSLTREVVFCQANDRIEAEWVVDRTLAELGLGEVVGGNGIAVAVPHVAE